MTQRHDDYAVGLDLWDEKHLLDAAIGEIVTADLLPDDSTSRYLSAIAGLLAAREIRAQAS